MKTQLKLIKALLLIVLLTYITSCTPAVEGNGNKKTKNFDLASFKNISIKGKFSTAIKQGRKQQITLTTDENLFDHINVEVSGETLVIEAKERLKPKSKNFIQITTPSIENLDLSGSVELSSKSLIKSNELSINGSGAVDIDLILKVDKLNIDISGASEIDLKGNATLLNVDISGAGELSAYELMTDEASLNISGAGSAQVNVESALEIDITGAGEVDYKGNPKLDQHITGAGKIERK